MFHNLVPKFSGTLATLSKNAGLTQTCLQVLSSIILCSLSEVKIV